MSAEAQPAARQSPERQWWLRALAVVVSPRPVFAALRNESKREVEAREEPVLALVILAGIAGILLAPDAGRLLDEELAGDSALVLAVLVFLSGAAYGIATYWIGGAFLWIGLRGAGSRGTYRRARHVFAFAAAPLALGLLVVWPLRLLVHGMDTFRTGGADEGLGATLFNGASTAFALWALGLLVYGISVLERWSLLRAAVSVALAVLAVLILTFPLVIPLSSR